MPKLRRSSAVISRLWVRRNTRSMAVFRRPSRIEGEPLTANPSELSSAFFFFTDRRCPETHDPPASFRPRGFRERQSSWFLPPPGEAEQPGVPTYHCTRQGKGFLQHSYVSECC